MGRRIPPINTRKRILIICEGYEEYDYIMRLKDCNVWDHSVVISVRNAHSIDKISPIFSYSYKSANFDEIYIFCDTEDAPYEKFLALKDNINNVIDNEKQLKNILIFANPCSMQIILSHFDKVALKSNKKSDNAPIIEKLTGVSDYKATDNQRKNIMKKIDSANYITMKGNIINLSSSYKDVPSTNCLALFKKLESQK